jgi:UDP-glucose 4-epimerase
MRRILITGAGGFVGSGLVCALADQNLVFGVSRHQSPSASIIWDFQETLSRDAFPSQVDVIIHAGALLEGGSDSARDYETANVLSCIQLAEFALTAGASHFVYLSTGGVYGSKEGWLTESTQLDPQGFYASSKLRGEVELQKAATNMNLTILRLFFPYGPDQKGRLIPNLMNKIRSGDQVRLNNIQGSPRINPIFISDLIAIIKEIIERGISGVINMAGPDAVSIRDLAEMIGRRLNKPVVYEVGDAPAYDLLGDITKICSLLPDLQLTDLDEGLAPVFRQANLGLE